MSILIDEQTTFIIQGITGREAVTMTRELLDYGSKVIGEVELDIPPPDRADRRPELELDIIGLQPRQNFTLVIDDREVARFATDDRGSIDRELQEGETIPAQ